jgi:hypothetical protein
MDDPQRLQHLQRPLSRLQPLPYASPLKAAALCKQAQLDSLIQLSNVSVFLYLNIIFLHQ